MNLVSNAIKFTSKNGEVNVNIEKLSESPDSVEVRFSVSDTGIGITESRRRIYLRLFHKLMSVQAESMVVLV